MLDQVFADIGLAFSAAFGGPFHDARVVDQIAPEYDDGGSIIVEGSVAYRPCQCQIDIATQAMREVAGFVEGSVRFIILSATLEGIISTDAEVEVLAGPFAGQWSVQRIECDPVAAGYVGVGRRG